MGAVSYSIGAGLCNTPVHIDTSATVAYPSTQLRNDTLSPRQVNLVGTGLFGSAATAMSQRQTMIQNRARLNNARNRGLSEDQASDIDPYEEPDLWAGS